MTRASLSLVLAASTLCLATGCAPTLVADWKVTSDVTAAGFATLDLTSAGAYTQTGRTDGQSQAGTYSEPTTITIDPDFGSPPAGMTGPYLQLVTDDTGDGQWDYGYTLTSDTLTLTAYAQRFGMGLRWEGTPFTITLTNQ